MDSPSITQLILVCLWLCSFILSIGLASSEVNITAVKPCRLGDTISVSCKVSSIITQCLWEVNGALKKAPALRVLKPTSGKGTWECGVEAEATEDVSGSWVCKVFTESGRGVAQQAGTTISIISVPSVSLRPATDRTTLTAGEETQVICVVNDARPVPTVVWKIGDIEVDSKDYTVHSQVDRNTKATMNSVLKRRFVPEDNKKVLQCIAEADWLRKEDNTATQTILDIQFPPMSQDAITIYGFEENQPGEVRVTVHANPHPHRAFWILPTPSNDKLEVEEKPVDDIVANNYVGRLVEDNGNDTYTYRLNINLVQQRDANPGIKFQVFSTVGTSEASEQYLIHAVTHPRPEPVPPTTATSGSTACCAIVGHRMFLPLLGLAFAVLLD